MKITINLSDAEVKGIKEYLKSVDCKPTKENIISEVNGMINSELQCGAIGDYVNHFTNPDFYPKFWK